MSFSKAKLKRFNEIPVTDSPCSDRKDHIKKFLKEVKDAAKEAKEKEQKNPPSTPSASDTESTKSFRTMRLFRTPSLPRRLRFKSSDTTPKKELQKDILKGKEALEAANVEIKNKTEVLQDYQKQVDDLRTEIMKLKENETKTRAENAMELSKKDETITEMTKEINILKMNNETLKDEGDYLKTKTTELENEIKMLLESHENEINFLLATNSETELNRDKLLIENKKLFEENSSLKAEIDNLIEEMQLIRLGLQANEDKCQEKCLDIEKLSAENMCLLEEVQTVKKQIEDDMLQYVKESEKMLKELDNLKYEKNKINSELAKKIELIKALEEELSDKDIDLDSYRDSIKESFEEEITSITKKYEQQIATLKEINEMKIKEIESIHVLDTSKMCRYYQEKINAMQKEKTREVERAHEIAEEKIRIAEIQNEQKIKALEIAIDEAVEKEKIIWKAELEKCQKIAETEIYHSELEKRDLRTLLESANEMLKEREETIKSLEGKLNNGIDYYIRINEQLEAQISEVKQECARLMTEKYNYQLTLNNTRSTVNILMERLKKSDSDVEALKIELEAVINSKQELEARNLSLESEMLNLRNEMDEYKKALTALRNSSQALEREMQEKEIIFEKLMTSEEETLETVNKIGKLFNEKIEENIDKYFEMYVDLKRKYEARETYIKDMKTLLDEFATGIELARIELDTKDKQLMSLHEENKNIQLENMTLKYKCEQFEKYQNSDLKKDVVKKFDRAEKETDAQSVLISDKLIENILEHIDSDLKTDCDILSSRLSLDALKIIEENKKLKSTLSEQIRRNNILQEMIELESENAVENASLKKKIEETDKALKNAEKLTKETTEKYNELKNQTMNLKNVENLKETNTHLKNKILQLQTINKEQEVTITELQDKKIIGTPHKTTTIKTPGTPRTPKTPKTPKSLFSTFPGKENLSPSLDAIKSPKGVLKPRN